MMPDARSSGAPNSLRRGANGGERVCTRGGAVVARTPRTPLIDPELHRGAGDRGHRVTVLDGGREPPLVDGLHRGRVEGGNGLDHARPGDVAAGVDEDLHLHRALDLLDERLLRVLRLGDLDGPRGL